MSTSAALYYPHTNITDKNIIKNSLLLWDQLEYITPAKSWQHSKFQSKYFNEAIEIIAKPHYPTMPEREEVHERVSSLIKRGLPPWFFLDAGKNVKNYQTYPIYPEKLDPKTWKLLRAHNLVRFNQMDSDFHASSYFGLMIMSLLADACAGELKRKVTDRSEAYAWLQKYSTAEAGGEYIVGQDIGQLSDSITRLVTISIKVMNTDDIPISTLVAMRKREAKSASNDYRKFRMNYLKKIDDYVQEVTKPKLRETDIQELERRFKNDMENELKDLKGELNVNKRKSLLSKEVLTAVTAAAGAIALPMVGLGALATAPGAAGIGALIRVGDEYKEARKKILRGNSMSWLYLGNKRANRFNLRKVII